MDLLTPDREQGGFTVRVPALQGGNPPGHALEEALANARKSNEV